MDLICAVRKGKCAAGCQRAARLTGWLRGLLLIRPIASLGVGTALGKVQEASRQVNQDMFKLHRQAAKWMQIDWMIFKASYEQARCLNLSLDLFYNIVVEIHLTPRGALKLKDPFLDFWPTWGRRPHLIITPLGKNKGNPEVSEEDQSKHLHALKGVKWIKIDWMLF